MLTLLVFSLLLSLCGISESQVSYDGYSLFRITPTNELQLRYLLRLNANTTNGLDFWLRTTAVNKPADVMVYPWAKDQYIQELTVQGIPFVVLHQDLGRLIDDDKFATINVPEGLEFFSDYQPLDEIYSFLRKLAEKNPRTVTVVEIGSSFEGRPLLVLKISVGLGNEKPAIWIQGGAHAREMVGPSTALYIAFMLATNKEHEVIELIKSFDWYIYPVVNPDGYEFALREDRLWRKTRSINENKTECVGVDANRNWDLAWSGSLGASTNPCSNNYAGPKPFSEPETRSIVDFMQDELKDRLLIFLDFHSYSQRWLSPWGYTSALPENYLEQKQLSTVAVSALEKVYGTKYLIGSSGNEMYTVTGGARDWVYGVMGAPFSYVIEVRDQGEKGGFLLPKAQILPTGEETWAGVKAMAEKVAQGFQ